MRKAIVFVLVLLLFISSGLVGCGEKKANVTENKVTEQKTQVTTQTETEKPKGGKTITLATYQNWLNDGLKAVLELYKEKTGNEVKAEVYPDDQFQNLMKTKLATGDVPELFANHPNVAKYPEDTLAALKAPWKDKVLDHIIKYCTRKSDGQIIAAPYGATDYMGLMYNKKVFEKAGISNLPFKTFDDFIAACEKIKNTGSIPLYIPNKEGWTAQILLLNGLNPLFKNVPGLADRLAKNEIKFNESAELIEAMDNVLSVKKKGFINEDYMSATLPMALEAVTKGNAGMFAILTNMYANVKKDYPELVGDTGMIPFTTVNSGINVSMGGSGHGILMPRDAKDKETAEDFINMLMEDEFLKLYYEKQPGTPPIKDMIVTNIPLWNQEMQGYSKELGVEDSFNLQYFPDFWSNMNIGKLGQDLIAADDSKAVLKLFYEEVSQKAKSNRVAGW